MFRMTLMTLFLIVLFFFAGVTDILAIISHRITGYVAFVLLMGVLITAFFVLRKQADKGIKNEEDDK